MASRVICKLNLRRFVSLLYFPFCLSRLLSRWWAIRRGWMWWSGLTLCSCSSACPPSPSCWSWVRWSAGRTTSCVCGGSTPTNYRSSTASSQVTHTAMLPVRTPWIHIDVSFTAVNLELGDSSEAALNASCFRLCISAGIGCPVPRIPAEASPLADHVSATRILCGALVFPTIATIVGKLMFSSVNSNLQRTILVSTSWISDASQCRKPSFICCSVLICQWWIHIIQIYLHTDLYLNNSIGHFSTLPLFSVSWTNIHYVSARSYCGKHGPFTHKRKLTSSAGAEDTEVTEVTGGATRT